MSLLPKLTTWYAKGAADPNYASLTSDNRYNLNDTYTTMTTGTKDVTQLTQKDLDRYQELMEQQEAELNVDIKNLLTTLNFNKNILDGSYTLTFHGAIRIGLDELTSNKDPKVLIANYLKSMKKKIDKELTNNIMISKLTKIHEEETNE